MLEQDSSLEHGLVFSVSRTTEIAAGVLAQRFNTRIEYDAKNMKVTNHDGMDKYIKEPARNGWEYGEEVW